MSEPPAQVPVREGAQNGKAPERTVFEVKSNKVLPCRIDVEFPVYNRKHTLFEISVYTSIFIRNFKQTYLVATKKTLYSREFVAPEGAIIKVTYRSGSSKHTYYSYYGYFLVRETGAKNHEFTIKGYDKNNTIEGEIKNLVPLSLEGYDEAEIEAEIMNVYGALPSKYDPVEVLYYLWIKKRVADTSTSDEEQVKKLEELIKQKEQELQALREQLAQLKQLERVRE
ncbi:MAG: hypothetical protein QXU30_07905 [Sulfolobales archaeon]